MGKIEYRDFDGDLGGLASAAHAAWFAEYGDKTWYDLFRPEFLRFVFAEVPDPRFLVAGYDGSRLVAFIANLPRRYRLDGRTYLGVVATQLIVHPDYKGAGAFLIAECLRRNADLGADFVLMQFDKTGSSWRLFDHLPSRHHIEMLRDMIMIVRPVDLTRLVRSEHLSNLEVAAMKLVGAHKLIRAPLVSGQVRPFSTGDLGGILELMDSHSDRDRLVRVFDRDTLERRLDTPAISSTLVYERHGAVTGLVNFTLHEMVSTKSRNRWAWLDFVFWENLDRREKRALLSGLWQFASEQECIGVMEWDRGYYDKMPLFGARFIPYPRFVRLSAWVLNPTLSLSQVRCAVEQVL